MTGQAIPVIKQRKEHADEFPFVGDFREDLIGAGRNLDPERAGKQWPRACRAPARPLGGGPSSPRRRSGAYLDRWPAHGPQPDRARETVWRKDEAIGFGRGPEAQTLYITAGKSLYRIRLNKTGYQLPSK